MHIRALRPLRLLDAVVVLALGLGAASGCGSEKNNAGSGDALANRARAVAQAWDGSTAAAAWQAGYHPMGEVVQPPSGGLRSQADKDAFLDNNFVLKGRLPSITTKEGLVTWSVGRSLTRPLKDVAESYEALSGGRTDTKPPLTVVAVKLGQMTVSTSRGKATVPAWLFTLEGYDSPLKPAAALASPLPTSPVASAGDIPGASLDQLAEIAEDGRSVTVVAVQGACDEIPPVTALETRDSLVLSASVKHRKDGELCTKQAKLRKIVVKLAHSVGSRVVLDARTGQPLPYKPLHNPSPSWS